MSLPPVCVQCEAPLIEGAPVPGEGVPEGAPEGAGAAGLAGDAAAELAAAEQAELAAAAAAEADEAGGVGGGGLVAQDGIPAVPTEPSAAGMDTLTAAGCMDTAVATPAATSGEVVKQQSLSKSGPPSPVAHPSSSGQLSHFLIPTNHRITPPPYSIHLGKKCIIPNYSKVKSSQSEVQIGVSML